MKRAPVVFVIACAVAAIGFAQSIGNQGYSTADVQSIKRMKDVNPQMVKARDLVSQHKFAEAEKVLAEVLGKVPGMSEAHFLMAKVHYGEKRWPEALASMEKAEQTLGQMGAMMTKMNEDKRRALTERRRAQEAVIADLKGRRQPLPLELQTQLDRAEQLRGEIDRSLNELNEPMKSNVPPEYPFFHGNIFLRMQRFSEAIAKYDEALRIDPGYADAANNLASVYYAAKQYQKAAEVLSRVEARGATVNPELKKAITDALPKS